MNTLIGYGIFMEGIPDLLVALSESSYIYYVRPTRINHISYMHMCVYTYIYIYLSLSLYIYIYI